MGEVIPINSVSLRHIYGAALRSFLLKKGEELTIGVDRITCGPDVALGLPVALPCS